MDVGVDWFEFSPSLIGGANNDLILSIAPLAHHDPIIAVFSHCGLNPVVQVKGLPLGSRYLFPAHLTALLTCLGLQLIIRALVSVILQTG
ncbi:hypothetical protein N9H22_05405, partial [Opitutales bacterium]|nr:hypothetical protein [Opitutales bacterium]